MGSDEVCRDIMSSQIVSNSDGYRYPTPEELEALSPMMQDVFATIQERTEGDKVVLYQVGPFAPEDVNEGEQAVGRAVAEVARDAGIDVVMDKDEMQRVLNENLSEIWQDLTTPSEEVFALSPKDTAKLNEIKKNLKSIEEEYKGKNTKHGVLTDLSRAF